MLLSVSLPHRFQFAFIRQAFHVGRAMGFELFGIGVALVGDGSQNRLPFSLKCTSFGVVFVFQFLCVALKAVIGQFLRVGQNSIASLGLVVLDILLKIPNPLVDLFHCQVILMGHFGEPHLGWIIIDARPYVRFDGKVLCCKIFQQRVVGLPARRLC